MKTTVKSAITAILLPVIDFIISPLVLLSSVLLLLIRRAGICYFPITKKVFMKVGIYPLRAHYYEPMFDFSSLRCSLRKERNLPGISWNVDGQLELLDSLSVYAHELRDIPVEKPVDNTKIFHFNNGSYKSGDAEFLYSIIRQKQPKRIIEIGSGNSTLIARLAVQKNIDELSGYSCHHVCIEPYEMPWLEKTGVQVIREKVEDCDMKIFRELVAGDILFIDSSHIIRPQGDVLFEYLEILPILNPGVVVHIHDIFSPRDYLDEWLHNDIKFWNEQYLLEAFLSHNKEWRIIAGLNFLQHNHHEKLKNVCPFLSRDREPGSFYIERVQN